MSWKDLFKPKRISKEDVEPEQLQSDSQWKLVMKPSGMKVGEFTAYLSHPRLGRTLTLRGTKKQVIDSALWHKDYEEENWRKNDEANALLEAAKKAEPEVMYL